MCTQAQWGLDDPGPPPSRPVKPRKPREMLQRSEEIWNSEDDSCTLGDALHLIPYDVPADEIHIRVEKNPNGYRYTSIVYDYKVPNTKYNIQLKDYKERLTCYERAIVLWEEDYIDWQEQKDEFDRQLVDMRLAIEASIKQQVA